MKIELQYMNESLDEIHCIMSTTSEAIFYAITYAYGSMFNIKYRTRSGL